MTIVGPSITDDYTLSFWTRECRKYPRLTIPPTPKERTEIILRSWPYKFPHKINIEFMWHICRIETQDELKNLWTHKRGDWLEKHGLWQDSGMYGVTLAGEKKQRQNLESYANKAIETIFFEPRRYPNTGQYKNYYNWKDKSLEGVLSGHEKPMLVQHEEYIDILDGFGRLLPYLVLILQGAVFFPFEAYFATMQRKVSLA